MALLGIKHSIFKYLKENKRVFFTVILFFLVGLFCGVFTLNVIGPSQKLELMQYMNNFFNSVSTKNVNSALVFRQSLINNFQLVIGLLILGITIIGIPVILFLISLKGFTIGFTVGFLLTELGLRGIIFSLISILPHNLIILPCICTISVMGINFSLKILRNRAFKKGFLSEVSYYSIGIITISVGILIGCLIEGYAVPVFIKMFVKYM